MKMFLSINLEHQGHYEIQLGKGGSWEILMKCNQPLCFILIILYSHPNFVKAKPIFSVQQKGNKQRKD